MQLPTIIATSFHTSTQPVNNHQCNQLTTIPVQLVPIINTVQLVPIIITVQLVPIINTVQLVPIINTVQLVPIMNTIQLVPIMNTKTDSNLVLIMYSVQQVLVMAIGRMQTS